MVKVILLIDDEQDLLIVTKMRLQAAGYEVRGVGSSEEALTTLDERQPDLILLDLVLPKMQGEELCKKLKSDTTFQHIPIILFTSKALRFPEDVQGIGADDYIQKPFDSVDMLEKIKKHLG